MSASPHALLADIAEHKRDVEGAVLLELTEYHKKLAAGVLKLLRLNQTLQQQSVRMLEKGVQAMELAMLNQSIQEQKQRIVEMRCEMAALDIAIGQQREKWVKQHQKHAAHQQMHQMREKKIKKTQENKQQAAMDNQFSTTMVAKQAQHRL